MRVIAYLVLFLATAFAVYAEDAPSKSHKPYYVGELGAQWEFPSDHLPRGMTVGNLHIAFWNILNKDYLFHIEENTQGLRKSAILRDNFFVRSTSSLTVREVTCAEIICKMVSHPTHPRSLIALQETHKDVQHFLKASIARNIIPMQWKIVTPPNQPYSQDIFLYDSAIFEFVDASAVKYSEKFSKTIFTLTLRENSTGKLFRFVQSHIPGGPNSAVGCAKFSEVALDRFDPDMIIVLMGDMNQSPENIENTLAQTAEKLLCMQPFTYVPIAHPSHMNTHMEASWIDNFFVYSPDSTIKSSDDPKELALEVACAVDALRHFHPYAQAN